METPSFRFPLERIRSLREQAEDQAREQLAQEIALRVRGEALLRQAAELTEAALETTRATSQGGASGSDFLAAHAWIERSRGQQHAAARDLDRCEEQVVARRHDLLGATRERQSIEKLAERRRAEHNAEWQRRSQGVLDEIALTMHRRGGALA